jgi:hypothetical protein
MNHGYAGWDGPRWNVPYAANGCPKLFLDAEAAFPMHLGGQRNKLYSDGAVSGSLDRVDFEDWERQSLARDVVLLWPNGDPLNDAAEGYIDDYHFLAPTGSLDLQVMYLAITNGTEIPFASAATLLNP